MKTLPATLALAVVVAVAATTAFAGPPRGKKVVPPTGSAAYRTAPAEPTSSTKRTMIEKSGKRTSTVHCDNSTAKCRVHCAN